METQLFPKGLLFFTQPSMNSARLILDIKESLMRPSIKLLPVTFVLFLPGGLVSADESRGPELVIQQAAVQAGMPTALSISSKHSQKEDEYFKQLERRLQKWERAAAEFEKSNSSSEFIIDLNRSMTERERDDLDVSAGTLRQSNRLCVPCHFLFLNDPRDCPAWYETQLEQQVIERQLLNQILRNTLRKVGRSMRKPLLFDGLKQDQLEPGFALG